MPDPDRPPWAGLAASVLDGFPDAVILLEALRDSSGAVVDAIALDANPVCTRDLRTTREELTGRAISDAIPFAAQMIDHIALALDGPEPLVVDNVMVENVFDHFRMMLDVRGVRTGADTLVLSWRDVTTYADLLDAAVLAEHRQRLLAENASDIVLLRGNSGITTWVSPSVTALLGWTVEDVEGTDLVDFVHADDRDAVQSVRSRVLQGHRPGSLLTRFVRRDGSERWMTCVSVPIEQDGVVVGATVGLRDVDQQVRAQQTAELSEQRYRLLAENASDVVALRDRSGRVQWISPSVEQLLGWDPDTLVGSDLSDLVAPEDRATASQARASVDSGAGEQRFVARFRHQDSTYRWMSVVGRPLADDQGTTTGAVIGLRDVDEQVRAQQAAEVSQSRYRLLAEHASDVIFLSDDRMDLAWVSPSSRDTLGWDSEQLMGRTAAEFIHDEDLASLRANVAQSSETGAAIRVRYRWRRPDGGYRWMEAVGRPFVDDTTGEQRRVVQLRDVHDQVLAERELSRRARYDELTGLLNRGEILRLLEERLADRRARAGTLAVVFCDVDGLKRVNDTLGHAAGDRLIEVYAQRIRDCLRDTDRVGRLGGDEVLIMLEGVTDVDAVLARMQRLVESMADPVEMPGDHQSPPLTFATTVSIGITLAVEGDTTDSVYARADGAMYAAKAAGGGEVALA